MGLGHVPPQYTVGHCPSGRGKNYTAERRANLAFAWELAKVEFVVRDAGTMLRSSAERD